ncbi:two-component system sensor histidine kinase NtrB [Amantichitinum ursilacus]|uniref:histidine kinase n=1 Tax=Amantichitinum ursilacus TaxID=857265 RepID=A0A0N1JRM1_9NEIS|nr:HAMP domain-containing sensor histidine kinase [Amantichitinum ursilacus]KPC49420.1 Sensor protein ZraS [Amantichitinum ursilacus]
MTDRATSEMHWRSLALLNLFRFLSVLGLFLGLSLLFPRVLADSGGREPFFWACAIDALLALGFIFTIRSRKPAFEIQLSAQVATDIVFLVFVMHLFGGVRSGIGILLLPYLAAAGLISRGRMTLFHAAMASLALLAEQLVRVAYEGVSPDDNLTPALLCVACFAVAWLGYRLSHYAEASEALAAQRGVDLANLGQVNQRILQDVSDGVVVVDAVGHVRQFNHRATELLGLPLTLNQPLVQAAPSLDAIWRDWREDRTQAPALLAGQAHKTLRPRMVPMSENASEADVLIYLEDMDRLRRESQQLKLAALGRLTANLAHEIRNPLSAIAHAAQLLGEEATDDPLMQRLTRIIDDNTRRLERMVHDVLELNRRDRVVRQDIELDEWLHTFLDEFRQVENIVPPLLLTCPPHVVVRFDPGHLHQVLWNLARNGWRYCSKTEGSLVFNVLAHRGRWRLDVINDGPPVPADAQTQLFEPFFTTDTKGTGLGLYIAREICAANAAHLEYLAPAEGGASFCITFGISDEQKNENR